jgi:hypothetical protein
MWDLLDDADPLSRTLSELAMHDECSSRMLDKNPPPPFVMRCPTATSPCRGSARRGPQ